ncbi:MAG: hypothetical protein M3Y93_14035, partial [Pseudomonadota bacterium]|nr:hypothetical protein [Pseudomonadota bacterium]
KNDVAIELAANMLTHLPPARGIGRVMRLGANPSAARHSRESAENMSTMQFFDVVVKNGGPGAPSEGKPEASCQTRSPH